MIFYGADPSTYENILVIFRFSENTKNSNTVPISDPQSHFKMPSSNRHYVIDISIVMKI